MKNLLIIAFLLLTSVYAEAQTITYLKVADKPEYAKYLEYCNTPVPRTFIMTGAVTILKTNNYYVQPNGDWMAKVPLTIKWYPFGTKSFTFEAYQKEIIARVEIMVPMRYPPSIDDFYKNWKTGNIQEGLVDSKTCGLWPGLK